MSYIVLRSSNVSSELVAKLLKPKSILAPMIVDSDASNVFPASRSISPEANDL